MSEPVKNKSLTYVALGVLAAGAAGALVLVLRSNASSASGPKVTPAKLAETNSASRRGKAPALEPAPLALGTAPAANDKRTSLLALTDTLEAEGDSAIQGHKIRGVFLTDPEAPKQVLDILSDGVDHKTATTLVFELGKAGTPQAQLVLADIFGSDTQSTRLRRQALIAAGGVTEPTPETRASLWEMFAAASASAPSQVGPAALLGLGRIGATLRDKDDAAYQEERTKLLAVLAEAREERSLQLALKALGNTHDPSLEPNASPYLADSSARIRAVAADTIGRLGGPLASKLLLDRLDTETIGWVRRNVVVGIYKLDTPSDEALKTISELVGSEQDVSVRKEMQRVLAKNSGG